MWSNNKKVNKAWPKKLPWIDDSKPSSVILKLIGAAPALFIKISIFGYFPFILFENFITLLQLDKSKLSYIAKCFLSSDISLNIFFFFVSFLQAKITFAPFYKFKQ